eukprot:NODE_263_length_12530_cov_0.434881.p5 type:complete len:376 gc:universal NODE_263_length_12530_cov_0.434881:9193-8066(-)
MVEIVKRKKFLVPHIIKYQKSLLQQPIHLHEWCVITDAIAELLDQSQFDILERLHNMFYAHQKTRFKRLYRIETGGLSQECTKSVLDFIFALKSDSILAIDYEDLRPLYIRALACVFGVTIEKLRQYFPRRTTYFPDAIGDLEELADDLDATELYDEPLKELMGIEPYDVPLPKFRVVNDFDSTAFPRLQYISEPIYHPICGDFDGFQVDNNGCNCAYACTNSCPCSKHELVSNNGDLVGGCSESCRCKKPCISIKYRDLGNCEHMLDSLEVFMTSDGRGWGVRALKLIKKDQYIGEYVGEVYNSVIDKHRHIIYKLVDNLYTFGIDRHIAASEKGLRDPEFYLDATYYGNITRFFNHDCKDSNLKQVFVTTLFI